MDKKVNELKTVIYIVLAILADLAFINLPIMGALSGLGIWEALHNGHIVFGLIFGLIFGTILVIIFKFNSVTIIISIVLFIAFILMILEPLGIFLLRHGNIYSLIIFELLFSKLISAIMLIGIAIFLVFRIDRSYPFLQELPEIIKQIFYGLTHPGQIKEFSVGVAIASFIIIYIFTVLIFSFWYYALYLEDYSYFKIAEEMDYPVWWQFCYFSLITILTVGYGDMSPMGVIPQVLVSLEVLVGFGLVAFYLTTIFQIVSRIEPKSESLQSQEKDRQISELLNEILELTKKSEQNQSRLRSGIIKRNWRRH